MFSAKSDYENRTILSFFHLMQEQSLVSIHKKNRLTNITLCLYKLTIFCHFLNENITET